MTVDVSIPSILFLPIGNKSNIRDSSQVTFFLKDATRTSELGINDKRYALKLKDTLIDVKSRSCLLEHVPSIYNAV